MIPFNEKEDKLLRALEKRDVAGAEMSPARFMIYRSPVWLFLFAYLLVMIASHALGLRLGFLNAILFFVMWFYFNRHVAILLGLIIKLQQHIRELKKGSS